MATADVIMIASSPPRVFTRSPTPARLSSSPSLLSVQKLLGLRENRREKSGEKELKTVSNVRDGFGGFQKPSALLVKGAVGGVDYNEEVGSSAVTGVKDKSKSAAVRPAKEKKDAGEASGAGATGKKTKKRKSDEGPSSTTEGVEGAGDHLEGDGSKKKTKNSTGKKTAHDSQTEIRKGKVIKPGVSAGEELDAASTGKKTFAASKKREAKPTALEDHDLQLEAAPVRRTDWTPVKSTPFMVLDETEDEVSSKTSSFALLTGSFGYSGDTSKSKEVREDNEALVKKRSVEVSPTFYSRTN
jgi:hypothetical protein